MIIHDHDILRPTLGPDKADAPLIVDPDAVLSRSIAFERFQAIAWRGRQITQDLGVMQLSRLALRDALDGTRS